VDLVVEGRVIGTRGDDGTPVPARIAVNPITLSAHGETLYVGAIRVSHGTRTCRHFQSPQARRK
jgi:hypothetical protein